MKCDLDQVLKIISAFVTRSRGATAVSAHTKLFQEGFVDSFSLVELTAELAAGLGVQLPDGSLIPEDFESPQAVFDRLQQI